MKIFITLIIAFFVLSGCKEKSKGFNFDLTKMTYLYKYQYEYEQDKKKSVLETTYYLKSGTIQDSTKIETLLEYNNKDLLIQEVSRVEKSDYPSYRLYNYNSEDSLESQFSINSSGDTMFWEEYKYFQGERKTVYHRTILVYYDYNVNPEEEKYDTTFFKSNYEYKNDKLNSLTQFDFNDNLSKIVEFSYENGDLTIEKHFRIIGSEKALDKIKYYDYTKSKTHPDYFSLDINNDTVEYCKMEFEEGKPISNTEVSDYGDVLTKLYMEDGKEIGLEMFWFEMNQKAVDSYSYNERGDLNEMKSYEEEITPTNPQ
jgi:hypothetical protein